MIVRFNRELVRSHPARAGLLWTAMFIPLVVVIQFAFGQPVHGARGVLVLVLLALVAGQAWGFLTRAAFKLGESRR